MKCYLTNAMLMTNAAPGCRLSPLSAKSGPDSHRSCPSTSLPSVDRSLDEEAKDLRRSDMTCRPLGLSIESYQSGSKTRNRDQPRALDRRRSLRRLAAAADADPCLPFAAGSQDRSRVLTRSSASMPCLVGPTMSAGLSVSRGRPGLDRSVVEQFAIVLVAVAAARAVTGDRRPTGIDQPGAIASCGLPVFRISCQAVVATVIDRRSTA